MSAERHPQNDASSLFIHGREHNIGEIIDAAKAHFGEAVDINSLTVDVEEIQFRHFGYDLYDSADYRTYTIVAVA